MRFHCAVVLAILVGVGVAQTILGVSDSIDSVHATRVDKSDAPFKTLLPPNDTVVDDEERVGGVPASAIKNVKASTSTETLRHWFIERKCVSDVFTELKLAQAGTNLFDDPQFMTLLRYAQYFNAKNPLKVMSKALTVHYSDEDLFKMLNEAKKNPNTKDIAIKLYAEKLRGWLVANKTPGIIFKQLGLEKTPSIVLTKPLFITYVNYLKLFNKENPGMKVELLEPHLRYRNHNYLNKLVEEAMKYPSTEKIHKTVQVEQLNMWLRSKTHPDIAFDMFVFRNAKGGDNFLTSQNFKLWIKYFDDFNKRYPDEKTKMIDAFRVSYSDEELAKMFAKAKTSPDTEKLATNLQLPLLNTWVRELKSPDEVSTILNMGSSNPLMNIYVEKFNWALAQARDKLFDDPKMWLKYVEYFKARHPASDASTITILTNRYGDDVVAKMIAVTNGQKMAEQWKTPEDVFKLLRLDQTGSNLLENPVLETWFAFVKLVKNDRFLTKVEVDILTRSYGDEGLSKILIAGKDTPRLRLMASDLQAAQISAWLKSKKDFNDVYKWLKVKGTTKDNPERLIYKKYVRDYRRKYLEGDTTGGV